MISALLSSSDGLAAPILAKDLAAAGLGVHGESDCSDPLQDLVRKATDIATGLQETPDAAFPAAFATIAASAAYPIVVFTTDPHPGKQGRLPLRCPFQRLKGAIGTFGQLRPDPPRA